MHAATLRDATWSSRESKVATAQEALATGKGVAELVLEHGLLTADQLTELLSPQRLANLSK